MRRVLLPLLLAFAFAGPASGDEVQAARDRAKTLIERSVALAARVAGELKPQQAQGAIFATLLTLDPHDGSSIGVYDSDSRRVAWVGEPVDPLRLPEVDPSQSARFVAATRSRAALVVTAKAPAPWFVLVSAPLLETRRAEGDQIEVFDVLDPARTLGLDYCDHSADASTRPEETITALGVTLARVSR
ncbi:MAG: hypothetical protein KBH14_00760, partial [Vicinamibacteria bacterium]|nr:hypothetical protein [Vicinamibacteria bacterium]